ncbi:MAG: hypothetical protein ACRDK0_00305, partial [Solirubrobacteraceae bacterium]
RPQLAIGRHVRSSTSSKPEWAGPGHGIAAGLLLQRAGFSVSELELAVTVAVAGLVLALTTQAEGVLADARTYAALLGLVALANLALAARDRLAAKRGAETPTPAWRRTPPMLAVWVAATVLAGVPGGPDGAASAQTRSAPAPKIVHSGPECMAGKGAAPAKDPGGKD